jgi:tetrapyrrole methylase family protein / MazG family protein
MHITIASMNANGEIDSRVLKKAKEAGAVVLQTDIPNTLKEEGIAYETLDSIYEEAEDFDELKSKAAKFLFHDGMLFITLGEVCSNVIAAGLTNSVVKEGGTVSVIPGGDAALCLAFQSGYTDGTGGVRVYNAASLRRISETDTVLVINEIDNRFAASELKLKLSRYYDDMHEVFLADIRGMTGEKIPLCTLDCEQSYGYYTSMVISPRSLTEKKRYAFSDLAEIMDKLRARDGCPWDNEQTHESLKRYLIEESYEVIEAIDNGDYCSLYDELGDVLLQVAFHAKIAEQHGEFDISDVTTAICSKMISRHTHIFGNATASTSQEVLQNWEQIKKAEKGQRTQSEVLMNVPKSMPALMRSEKIQYKASHAGMDFPDIGEAFSKLFEEADELKESLSGGNKEEECGDLLFAAVNVARLAGVEPETALQKAVDKFIGRFSLSEVIAAQEGVNLKDCGIDKLNEIWDRAKEMYCKSR